METKKYIIEIPDNTAWLQWVKVSDKDGHVCFDFKDPEDLTLYTEPNLDAVRKEAYDKGYQDATVKIGSDEQAIAEKAYQKGLNDAWDAARKIVLSREDGGLFEYEARKSVFGCGNYMALKNYSASEAVKKIRQYEQEQEEIKVGDEVQHRNHSGIKVIVLYKDDDAITAIAVTNVPFACKVGEMYINRNAKYWEKTGKHYEIAEVLRKMRGEKMDNGGQKYD